MRIRVLAVLSVLFLALSLAPAAASAAPGQAGQVAKATKTTKAAKAKKPGKPISVVATAGKARYVVRWSAPKTGPKVKAYQVADRARSGKKWSAWKSKVVKKRSAVKKRSVVVKGKNGSKHQVRVRAKSAKGYGKWSVKRKVVIGQPGAPKKVAASQGDKKVTVSWRAAKANGAKVKSYRVQTRYKSGAKHSRWSTKKAPKTATSLTVTGLSNARAYQVRVAAVNKFGQGGFSAARTAARPSVSVTAGGPYAGNEKVTVRFAGFPHSESTLNVAVCANDGRPLSGPADCAPLGGASNKLVTPTNGAGTATLTIPKALGNEKAPAITCGPSKNCAIVVTTITSNFFMAGPVVLDYANPRMSVSPTGPMQGGKDVTVTFAGFPATETTLNVAVCANDGRQLSGPNDCAPFGASNKLVTPTGGAGSVTLTLPQELGNTNGPAITCGLPDTCAVVVTTITSNFFMAGPLAFTYVV